MKRIFSTTSIAFIVVTIAKNASPAIIYESGTLGPIGITNEQLLNQSIPGSNVDPTNYVGARFEVHENWTVTAIGGHFARGFADSPFFGVIVRLSDEIDFPDSDDLSTPDVLVVTHLSFPDPSAEVFGEISTTLVPGWYAVIFGTGLFQTNDWGTAVRNGQDIGTPSYIIWQPSRRWFNVADMGFGGLPNHRFVVVGNPVPEPSCPLSVIVASFSMFGMARWRRSPLPAR